MADELKPAAWQRNHPVNGWIDCREEDVAHYRSAGQEIRELFIGPSAWQDIASAPRDGTRVLIHVDGQAIEAAFDAIAGEWFAGQWGLGFGDEATNWQPLPPPPVGEQ